MGAYFALLETAPETRAGATNKTITEAFDEVPFFGNKLPPAPGPIMPGETWKLKPNPFHGRGKYTIALAKPVEMIRQNPCVWVRVQPVMFGVENGITCENIIGIFGALSAASNRGWIFDTVNNLSTAMFEIVLVWLKIFQAKLTDQTPVRANLLLIAITEITARLAETMLAHHQEHNKGKDVNGLDKVKEAVSELYSKLSTKIKRARKQKRQKGTRIIDQKSWDEDVTRRVAGQKLKEHFLEFRSHYFISNAKLLEAGVTNTRGESEFQTIYEALGELTELLIDATNEKLLSSKARLDLSIWRKRVELPFLETDLLMIEPLMEAFMDLVMPEAENKFQQSFPFHQQFESLNLTPERLLGPYQTPIMEILLKLTKKGAASFSNQTFGEELPDLDECVTDLHEDAAETIKKLFSSEDMNEKYVALELAGIAWQEVNKIEIDLL